MNGKLFTEGGMGLRVSGRLSVCGRGVGVGRRRLCGAEGQAHQPLLSITLDKDAWENFTLSEATSLLRNARSALGLKMYCIEAS